LRIAAVAGIALISLGNNAALRVRMNCFGLNRPCRRDLTGAQCDSAQCLVGVARDGRNLRVVLAAFVVQCIEAKQ
jgi:hypothetical protein